MMTECQNWKRPETLSKSNLSPTLQIKELRLRKVSCLAEGHTVNEGAKTRSLDLS